LITLLQDASASPTSAVAPFLFYAFAALVVLSAWAIVLSQNIVRMAVYLLLTLGGVAGMYFMLNAELLAAIRLIVYAGGTLILIIFGVMLTSRNPFMQLKASTNETILGLLIGIVTGGLLIFAVVTSEMPASDYANIDAHDNMAFIGSRLITEYIVPFEIAGVLLLVVMIGAAYMARRRDDAKEA